MPIPRARSSISKQIQWGPKTYKDELYMPRLDSKAASSFHVFSIWCINIETRRDFVFPKASTTLMELLEHIHDLKITASRVEGPIFHLNSSDDSDELET